MKNNPFYNGFSEHRCINGSWMFTYHIRLRLLRDSQCRVLVVEYLLVSLAKF
jgi:hypothetical protein